MHISKYTPRWIHKYWGLHLYSSNMRSLIPICPALYALPLQPSTLQTMIFYLRSSEILFRKRKWKYLHGLHLISEPRCCLQCFIHCRSFFRNNAPSKFTECAGPPADWNSLLCCQYIFFFSLNLIYEGSWLINVINF